MTIDRDTFLAVLAKMAKNAIFPYVRVEARMVLL